MEIFAPRGATLAGTFINPVDSTDAAVVFSHSFLADRKTGLHFERLAAAYRALGYATLQFDYSGHGRSSDEPITMAAMLEDLRSASGWLADQGFTRQLLHGHSFGALPALLGRPPAVETMVLSGPITGPLSYNWEDLFSSEQLEELERTGVMSIYDDSPGPREYFRISQEILSDITMNQPAQLVEHLDCPVLLIHDGDDQQRGLLELSREILPLLPQGSRIVEVLDSSFCDGENLDALSDAAKQWAGERLPVRQ